MKAKNFARRLGFYWLASFLLASGGYFLLWVVLTSHAVFGAWYRMFLYHWEHPLPYIVIPCFFYGILAAWLTGRFAKVKSIKGQMGWTALIVGLTLLLSSPFGGMLWHYHDMQAGYFPDHWLWIFLSKGISWELTMGWLIVLLSFPYNLLGVVLCFYLNKMGATLFTTKAREK